MPSALSSVNQPKVYAFENYPYVLLVLSVSPTISFHCSQELIHGAPINKPVGNRASVSLVFVPIKSAGDDEENDREKRFQRLIIGNASEYRVDGRQLSATEYTEELENMGILPKAKNFLIFQGQVESIAMKTPKEFTAMFEELSRSGELREEYEQAKQEKNKAEQDTHANFQKKKGVEKQKKEVRLEKEVAQKYAALKTQYVRGCFREIFSYGRFPSG